MVMPDRLMHMGVSVRFIRPHLLRVLMLVVLIMAMPMSVSVCYVLMAMIMAFGKVQPHPRHHKRCGQPEQQLIAQHSGQAGITIHTFLIFIIATGTDHQLGS